MRVELTGVPTLVAHTVELVGDVDLAAVAGADGVLWEQDGTGFAGRGVAARISVAPGGLYGAGDQVAAALRAVEVEGGFGPLAFGALPFSPAAGGQLVLPETLVRREVDGSCWVTTTEPLGSSVSADRLEAMAAAPNGSVSPEGWAWSDGPTRDGPPVGPDEFTIITRPSHGEWCHLVRRAVRAIAAGELSKVVLAREVEVVANQAFSVAEVVRRLRVLNPTCMIFAAGGFVGASPELLVARQGSAVRSHPLAGTTVASGDPVADQRWGAELLASPKEREEHRLAVDAVAASLAPFCSQVVRPDAPSVMALGNLAHLGTAIEGTLCDPLPSVLDLVAAVHPSPAVAGVPRETALAFIAAQEGFDRGRYAGPVGWVDADGNGQWALAIRSAQLAGNRARLFAGNGLVAGSDPAAELAETQLKLQSMLGAIVRP